MTTQENYSLGYLTSLGFVKPNITPLSVNGLQVNQTEWGYAMYEGQNRWMTFSKDYSQVFELYSHFAFAKGHCICTGMGFLLRESWLLQKPEVTKVTVVEKNANVIAYQKIVNPEIMSKIEVINSDVYNFSGECDTLLLDNFEGGIDYHVSFLLGASAICEKIKSNTTWMWPMESIINTYYKNFIGLSLHEIYNKIKTYFRLSTFPELTEEELFYFCQKFYVGNFTRCNFNPLPLNYFKESK